MKAFIGYLKSNTQIKTRGGCKKIRAEALQAAEYWVNTPGHIWKNQNIVYARVNLKNKDLCYTIEKNLWQTSPPTVDWSELRVQRR